MPGRLVFTLRVVAIGAVLAASSLTGCGTVGRITARPGASNDADAMKVTPEDPMARPIQVGWTSARASHCGFVFDPAKLRSDFLASEASSGIPPDQMKKVEQAYDYTHDTVRDTIKDDMGYCTKARLDAIRSDLNRYLAGNFAPAAHAGK